MLKLKVRGSRPDAVDWKLSLGEKVDAGAVFRIRDVNIWDSLADPGLL